MRTTTQHSCFCIKPVLLVFVVTGLFSSIRYYSPAVRGDIGDADASAKPSNPLSDGLHLENRHVMWEITHKGDMVASIPEADLPKWNSQEEEHESAIRLLSNPRKFVVGHFLLCRRRGLLTASFARKDKGWNIEHEGLSVEVRYQPDGSSLKKVVEIPDAQEQQQFLQWRWEELLRREAKSNSRKSGKAESDRTASGRRAPMQADSITPQSKEQVAEMLNATVIWDHRGSLQVRPFFSGYDLLPAPETIDVEQVRAALEDSDQYVAAHALLCSIFGESPTYLKSTPVGYTGTYRTLSLTLTWNSEGKSHAQYPNPELQQKWLQYYWAAQLDSHSRQE